MKGNRLYCSLFFLGMFWLLSCSNSDDGIDSPVSDGCKISWKLNGSDEAATPVVCAFLDGTLNLGLIGSDGIQIQINNLTGPGTFALGITNDDAVLLAKDPGDNTLGAANGEIKVTTFTNNQIEGTFSGSMFDITDISQTSNFELTEGEFTAKF